MNLEFDQLEHFRIEVRKKGERGSIDSQSVEVCLLYAILRKLEEISKVLESK